MYQSLAIDVLTPEAHLVMQHPKTQSVAAHKLNVMLVEDVHSDAMLTRIALDATKIPYNLTKLNHYRLEAGRLKSWLEAAQAL